METAVAPSPDPRAAARDVALTYASDAEPGIRRRRAGNGFAYVWPNGRTVTDPAVRDRIAALAVPPAWTDVWIAPGDDCHLQATGKDARGRKQYRYHDRWTACRDEVKYANLIDFARALPRLRAAVEADLGRRGLGREKVIATVVWLLDTTLIRVGTDRQIRLVVVPDLVVRRYLRVGDDGAAVVQARQRRRFLRGVGHQPGRLPRARQPFPLRQLAVGDRLQTRQLAIVGKHPEHRIEVRVVEHRPDAATRHGRGAGLLVTRDGHGGSRNARAEIVQLEPAASAHGAGRAGSCQSGS